MRNDLLLAISNGTARSNRGCAGKPRTHPAGSITVEAAFVLPIALFALLCFLSFFTVLQVEAEMNEALQFASRSMAVKCGAAEYMKSGSQSQTGSGENISEENGKKAENIASYAQGAAAAAAGRQIAVKYLKENGCWTDQIKGGISGISFLASRADGDFVNLRADYKVSLPVSYFGIRELPVSQGVCARKWTGEREKENGNREEEGGWVYVTKTGSAYHKTLSCRYLNLSIRTVSRSSIPKLRNKDGGKYYPCSCTRRTAAAGGIVFVTNYGTEYHSDLSCSNLKRTIRKIKKSEAAGYHPCSGCAK